MILRVSRVCVPACGRRERPRMSRARWRRYTKASADLKQLLDRRFEGFGFGGGAVARDRLAAAVDQELGEVPFDRLGAEHARLLAGEIFVERVRVRAVHVDLGEHREGDAETRLAELGD